MASGKLQTLCYKEDIESALRTPGMAGFELLDLHDFPGQGTALVGVLDPFWDSKGYVTPDAYRRFAGTTVPLARLERRVFTTADTLDGRHRRRALRRRTYRDTRTFAGGSSATTDAWRPPGRCLARRFRSATARASGRIRVPLRGSRRRSGTRWSSSCPAARTTGTCGCTRRAWTRTAGDVLVTAQLDEAALQTLSSGRAGAADDSAGRGPQRRSGSR